jgi:hypothetical protein
MKLYVKIAEGNINVEGYLEGDTEADLFRALRGEIGKRLNFLQRSVFGALSDPDLMRRIVEAHNKQRGASEPIPADYKAFVEFAERAGYG